MKNKKESIVIFEDWFRYARCLNDSEFRTFMNAILQYYKDSSDPQFTGLMLEVWNDIFDDLGKNIQSRQNRRDTVEKNRQKNSKVNPLLRTTTTPTTIPTTIPTGRSTISPTTTPTTNGMVMVDGRWNMVDGKMVDRDMVDNEDGRDWMVMFRQGETPKSLLPKYPYHRNEITSSWMEYMEKLTITVNE